ncbi:sulfotransferase [Glaciecola sp. MH2013]|uniref:tetratricopeptide repeat-containing sulfotransferase family protein n=1 Tax=Glaciecola sp. MH2013 TaxID=2785524 RepID=UPI00189E551C|nr:sulfotransferase [Glaciecola sp. MH2013]MBF7074065.1 sulfotransferase [Glaciecola sp. MH2013]
MLVDELLQQAQAFYEANDITRAIASFDKAIELEPDALDIHINALACLLNAKKTDLALQRSSAVIELARKATYHTKDSALQQMVEQLASMAWRLNLYQECVDLLAPFESLSAQAKFTQVRALCALEHWADALAHCKALSEAYPNDLNVLNQLAICLVKMQNFDTAISVYQKLLKLAPSQAILHIKFADLYLLSHKHKLAREQLNIAIALHDSSIQRYELECKLTIIENDKNAAIAAAKAALKIRPYASFAWQIIEEFGTKQDVEHCITRLKDLEEDKLDYDAQHNAFILAKAYQKCERFDEAFAAFERANRMQKATLKRKAKCYKAEEIEAQYTLLKAIEYDVQNPSSVNDKPGAHYFIVGMPRSGTTLVNRVLSQQNDFESCGESNAVATLFERLLLDTHLSNKEKRNSLRRDRLKNTERYRSFNHVKCANIIDKMPHNFRYVGAILASFDKAKVIQMRRNVSDLAFSIFSQFFNQQHNYSVDLKDIAHAIYQANKLMDHWRKRYPEQVIDVNYDELVKDPSTHLQRLFSFCKLDWDERYLDFHEEVVASFTFSETQVRQPIHQRKLAYSRKYAKQMQVVLDTYAALENQAASI